MILPTSVILSYSLLLLTYCYSIPLQKNDESSTSKYQLTSDKTMVNQDDTIDRQLNLTKKSTDLSDIRHQQTLDQNNRHKLTALDEFKYQRNVSDSSLPIEFSSASTTINYDTESLNNSNNTHNLDGSLLAAMSSTTQFNQETTTLDNFSSKIESSTMSNANKIKMTTKAKPSTLVSELYTFEISSVNSCNECTELDNDQLGENFTSTENNRSSEESITSLSISPDNTTTININTNTSSQTNLTDEHMEEQLNEGKPRSSIEIEESKN